MVLNGMSGVSIRRGIVIEISSYQRRLHRAPRYETVCRPVSLANVYSEIRQPLFGSDGVVGALLGLSQLHFPSIVFFFSNGYAIDDWPFPIVVLAWHLSRCGWILGRQHHVRRGKARSQRLSRNTDVQFGRGKAFSLDCVNNHQHS